MILGDEAAAAGLALLRARRSCHKLTGPGPDEATLWEILRDAMRAPDFQRLRPWRFLVAEGDGRDRLGAAMERAAIAAGQPDDVIARAPRMPHRAPVVVIVVATPRPDKIVPAFDQVLSAGCVVMGLQLSAQARGFHGVWRSGWLMHDRGFHAELGLEEADQIVGFFYMGAAEKIPAPPPEPDPAAFIQRL